MVVLASKKVACVLTQEFGESPIETQPQLLSRSIKVSTDKTRCRQLNISILLPSKKD